MSRINCPNEVCKRFIPTFKNVKMDNLIISEYLTQKLKENPQFSSFQAVVGKYCSYLNSKPNIKSKEITPVQYSIASSPV